MEAIVALTIVVLVVIILLMLIFSAIRVVQQYERGVIFVLGKINRCQGTWNIPGATIRHAHD